MLARYKINLYLKNIKEIKFGDSIIYIFYQKKKDKIKKYTFKYLVYEKKEEMLEEFNKLNNLINSNNAI